MSEERVHQISQPACFRGPESTPSVSSTDELAGTKREHLVDSERSYLQLPTLTDHSDLSLASLPLLVQVSDTQSGDSAKSDSERAYALVHVSPIATVREVKQELVKQGIIPVEDLPSVQLIFGEETLSENSPLTEYFLPELYDYSEALLRMIDQGGLDVEQKHEAMERALQVIGSMRDGISSGRESSSTKPSVASAVQRAAAPGSERLQLPGIDMLPRPLGTSAVHLENEGATDVVATRNVSPGKGVTAAPLWSPMLPSLSPTGASVIATEPYALWTPMQLSTPMDMAERLHMLEPRLFTPEGVSAVGAFVPLSARLRQQNGGHSARLIAQEPALQPGGGAISGTSSFVDARTRSLAEAGPLESSVIRGSEAPCDIPKKRAKYARAASGARTSTAGSSYSSDMTGQSRCDQDCESPQPGDASSLARSGPHEHTASVQSAANQRLVSNLKNLPDRWVMEGAHEGQVPVRGRSQASQGTEASSSDSRPVRLASLSPEERRRRRMEQNRKSAERSRLRKKELEQRYRAAVRQLSEENAELRRQLDSFREQIQRMQQLLAVQMRATSAPLDTPSQQ
jgi:hypothetical protein